MSIYESCESSLSGEDESIVLSCDRHGSVQTFVMVWGKSISAEHVYAAWLKHLMEQS